MKQTAIAGEIRCFVAQKTNSDYAKYSTGPNLDTTSTFASLVPLWGVSAQVLFGAPLERVFPCAVDYLSKNLSGAVTPGEGCEIEDPSVCEGMGIVNIADQANYKPKGNLMGFVSSMERSLQDNIPVSLAYYVNQNAKKIPGINQTALAQDTVEYGGPFLTAIYHYWTISRNIAYAFLAAAMTLVGVMIVMGKSIDPKAGITVQQALPQIIIALILITFSYPIGAAGASLAYNVRGSITSWDLFVGANEANNTAEFEWSIQTLFLGLISLVTPWAGLISEGGGPLILLIAVGSAAISLIMSFLVMFKIFGVYLKMLFAILSAPVSFAIGAMPGNSDTTMNWFKQYGSYMLSLPVMNFAAWFVFQLSMDMSNKALSSLDELGGWGFGRIAGLAIPVITTFGYSIVLTIPDKIDGMLGVKSK